MRTYKIHYYVESNDECQEREIEVEAAGLPNAFIEFQNHVRAYKRIFKIEEKAN